MLNVTRNIHKRSGYPKVYCKKKAVGWFEIRPKKGKDEQFIASPEKCNGPGAWKN
jgi:hypothetical protein